MSEKKSSPVDVSIDSVENKINIIVRIDDFLEREDKDWIGLRRGIKKHLIDNQVVKIVKNDD